MRKSTSTCRRSSSSSSRGGGLVVLTGECGLCGSFNNNVVKKANTRVEELKQLGLDYTVIGVGKKAWAWEETAGGRVSRRRVNSLPQWLISMMLMPEPR